MRTVEEVLGATLPEQARRINDEDPVLALWRLRPSKHHDGRRKARSKKDVRGETDHCLNEVTSEDGLAYLAFGTLAEQRALREHDGHTPAVFGHRRDHVLNPSKVAIAARR